MNAPNPLRLLSLIVSSCIIPSAAFADTATPEPQETTEQPYALKLKILSQVRYHHLRLQDDQNQSSVLIRHAQVRLSGRVMQPALQYSLSFEMAGQSGGATGNLLDM